MTPEASREGVTAAGEKTEANQVIALFDEIIEVLELERTAIAKLDAISVTRFAQVKKELAQKLRAVDFRTLAHDPSHGVLRARARRMQQLGLVNAALLEDAQASIADALGLAETPVTYDRRARQRGISSQPLSFYRVRRA